MNDNTIDNTIPLVVENGMNTCYIDALFVALFYKETPYTNFILETTPKNPTGYYLQELIKSKFVEPIRKHYSITSNIINEIRNYALICGWASDGNIDGQKDCSEFYTFMADLFNIPNLEFEILEIKNNTITNNTHKSILPFIPLSPNTNNTIRSLLIDWINTKIINNDIEINHCYKLTNIPQFIILNVNRFNYNGIRNNYKIDIMKRIKFFGNNDTSQNYLKWKIHSMVCHKGESCKSGHYYAITTTHCKKWLLFDDNLVPSFEQIDLEDDDIQNKIMLEAVLIIYILDI